MSFFSPDAEIGLGVGFLKSNRWPEHGDLLYRILNRGHPNIKGFIDLTPSKNINVGNNEIFLEEIFDVDCGHATKHNQLQQFDQVLGVQS